MNRNELLLSWLFKMPSNDKDNTSSLHFLREICQKFVAGCCLEKNKKLEKKGGCRGTLAQLAFKKSVENVFRIFVIDAKLG